MINNKKVLGVIPARGGSKGLPGKNLMDLCGKPLIAWTFEAAKKSEYISRVILSSEDNDIIKVGHEHGIDVPFRRPNRLSTDYSTGVDANPDWSVNYGDYMFNGVIHSTILNGEEIILEENDRIAAFVNSVCRGTTETFLAPDDPDLPFQDIFELQVYGDIPVTLVTAFTESDTRLSESDVYSTSNRNLNSVQCISQQ